jgi:nitroreductase
MEFDDVIRQRRAVRSFTTQPVDRELIARLIKKACLAPSAENHQPWEFAVVTSSQKVDEYATQSKAWLLAHPEALKFDPALQFTLKNEDFTFFYHAPSLVIVLAKSDAEQAKEDCCLAAQNFLLAARDQGLGTCWIGLARPWLNRVETKKMLGIPVDRAVVAPIVVGYPKQWPDSHGRNSSTIYWIG